MQTKTIIILCVVCFLFGSIITGTTTAIIEHKLSSKAEQQYNAVIKQRELTIQGLEDNLSAANSINNNIRSTSEQLESTSRQITEDAQRGLTIIDELEKGQSNYRQSIQEGSVQK